MSKIISVVHETTFAPTPNPKDFWREQVRLEQDDRVVEFYQVMLDKTQVEYTPPRQQRRNIREIAPAREKGVLSPECEALLARLVKEGWQLKETREHATGDPREQEYSHLKTYTLEMV